jgi:RNA polymerase sigma factor (sigma-70 family)
MDEKAKPREEGTSGERPLEGCDELVARLYEEAQAAPWGVSTEQFSAVLKRSLLKRMAGAEMGAAQREEFLCTLHLKDLALAQACAMGQEAAWESFVGIYRPYLRSAAAAILRASATSPEARELADSLFAELYGLADGKTGERSLFRYFHGRSSLKTWLRAVLAQRRIDAVRAAKRFESLDEPDGDGKVHEFAQGVATPLADPHRERYIKLFQMALAAAVERIESRDKLRLKLYYVEEKTLAEIGKKLGEHESSVSRNLDRIRREMRENTEEILGKPVSPTSGPGLSEAQIALCFEYAAEDVPIDLGKLLKENEAGTRRTGQKDKQDT